MADLRESLVRTNQRLRKENAGLRKQLDMAEKVNESLRVRLRKADEFRARLIDDIGEDAVSELELLAERDMHISTSLAVIRALTRSVRLGRENRG